jgi:hypothetical protein
MRGYAAMIRVGNFWREVPEIAEAGSNADVLDAAGARILAPSSEVGWFDVRDTVVDLCH